MATNVGDRAERRERHHEADVIVVGAGIFGCAMAHALAEQGRSVLLLERWMSEPDRIVGELLQPGGVAALQALGLGHCLEGIDATPCYGYHVIYNGDDVVIPYPAVDGAGRVQDVDAGPAGPQANGNGHEKKTDTRQVRRPEGRSFHHGRFVMQLRRACMRHPNITVVEADVTATVSGQLGPEVLGVTAKTTDPSTDKKRSDAFFATLTIIADGYASRFRDQLLGTKPVVRSKFYALELRDCPLAPHGFGHVVIGAAAAPVLLYQIGTHETRALIDVPLGLPAAQPARGGVRGYIRDVVLPALPPAARPSAAAALADGKIPRSMPNSWLPPTSQAAARRHTPGVLLAGDAANMRHPLTGGGMTVALSDVLLLAELLHPTAIPDLADRAAVRAAVAAWHRRRRALTAIINVLAQALYALFAAEDRPLRALQRGCFAYFERGYTDGPMGLLGGLIRRPGVLAGHFFSVAFLAVWMSGCDVVLGGRGGGKGEREVGDAVWVVVLLSPLRVVLAVLEGVMILWKACVVFLPVFWRELQ